MRGQVHALPMQRADRIPNDTALPFVAYPIFLSRQTERPIRQIGQTKPLSYYKRRHLLSPGR